MDNVGEKLLLYKRRRVSPPRPGANSVTKIDVSKVKQPETNNQKEDKTVVTNVGIPDINQDRERKRGRQEGDKKSQKMKKKKTLTRKTQAELEEESKIDRDNPNTWRVQTRRKTKNKQVLEIKPNVAEGNTSASVLRQFKQEINVGQVGVEIESIQKTRKGNLKIFTKAIKEDANKIFRESIKGI
ncbi:hypothetical protein ILUMI_03784 [Ignelater luminosus]|uniref:Uncharacterized protein n=1 Tax=Ignelater luminosus TaxID=2038154 RepID=A0A8K0DF49_IGNLU|nr:hypothetical protein ILUMI_03784 [Ignelater luminosus]